MDESKRRLDVRLLPGVLAAMLVAAAIWAGAAMAAGGSSSNDSATTDSRASSALQRDGEAPERGLSEPQRLGRLWQRVVRGRNVDPLAPNETRSGAQPLRVIRSCPFGLD